VQVPSEQSYGEICSKLPALFWYIFASFQVYWIFNLITTIITGNTSYWFNLSYQALLISGLVFFIYRIIAAQDDSQRCCRNTIAILFYLGAFLNFILIYFFPPIDLWITIVIIILSVNLIIAISAHYYLVSKILSQPYTHSIVNQLTPEHSQP
jgi:hypothetical protein